MTDTRCRVNKGNAPAPWQQTPCRGEQIGQGCGEFVARHGLLPVRIHPSASGLSVRRVAQHQVEALRGEMTERLPEIHLAYLDPAGQGILLDVPAGKSREVGLDFNPEDFVLRLIPVREHEWDHSAARSQLDDPIRGPDAGQARQENGIHGKAVAFPFLENCQASVKKGVTGESGRIVYRAISSQGERGFITRPLVTLG